MKFIVDAHLPPRLKKWLIDQGYDAQHTLDLPEENDTEDLSIIKYAVEEDRIVITKDSDFYKYNLLFGKPRRLLMITTGNISNKGLLDLFDANFSRIKSLYDKGSEIVEINDTSIFVHK